MLLFSTTVVIQYNTACYVKRQCVSVHGKKCHMAKINQLSRYKYICYNKSNNDRHAIITLEFTVPLPTDYLENKKISLFQQ